MDEIVESINQVAGIMNGIAAASLEQCESIQQVGQAVVHLDEIIQQNAALVEHAAASEALQKKGADSMQDVGIFRLDASYESKLPATNAAALSSMHGKGRPTKLLLVTQRSTV